MVGWYLFIQEPTYLKITFRSTDLLRTTIVCPSWSLPPKFSICVQESNPPLKWSRRGSTWVNCSLELSYFPLARRSVLNYCHNSSYLGYVCFCLTFLTKFKSFIRFFFTFSYRWNLTSICTCVWSQASLRRARGKRQRTTTLEEGCTQGRPRSSWVGKQSRRTTVIFTFKLDGLNIVVLIIVNVTNLFSIHFLTACLLQILFVTFYYLLEKLRPYS